jgi:hypothetical protein
VFRSKPIAVTLVVALLILAGIAALMGWLPLTPKNDFLRSLRP